MIRPWQVIAIQDTWCMVRNVDLSDLFLFIWEAVIELLVAKATTGLSPNLNAMDLVRSCHILPSSGSTNDHYCEVVNNNNNNLYSIKLYIETHIYS